MKIFQWFFLSNRLPLELPATEMRRRLKAIREKKEIENLEELFKEMEENVHSQ